MDYCSSCRRHLNGALVCPGCGAYAPDIAPTTTGGRIVPAPVAARTTGEAPSPGTASSDTWHAGRPLDGIPVGAVLEGTAGSDSAVELVGASTWAEGRAARRRQRARWRKNQRRAVVATAVALVGGGLTVNAMDRQSGDRAQAATAPQDPGTDAAEDRTEQETPPPSAAAQPDARRASAAPSTPSAAPPAPARPRRQYATTSLRTTSPIAEAHAAVPVHRTEPTAPQPQSTAPASPAPAPARTSTTDAPNTPTQPPAATDATDSPSRQPTTRPNATPASTSPSEICLLVVCLPVSSS
ncbi:SCO2400 family protein [Streptomyces vietnamensis]|uniref:SCO2400 family protein n=1 Tax=Streptomyces vietnamensis TaxID=362257 RepID=UPI003CCC3F28